MTTSTPDGVAIQGLTAGRWAVAQYRTHLPVLRDFPPGVLPVEAAVRRARCGFGPGKIADYLKRFHQQTLAVSSVHRILLRHGMNRLPSSQKHRAHGKRWQRYEKPQPGHRLQ